MWYDVPAHCREVIPEWYDVPAYCRKVSTVWYDGLYIGIV
jgi:hypothetical protein